MATNVETPNILSAIRDECLGAYRSQPKRLEGDVGNESENQSNYRGRFIYELLQNADDALSDQPVRTARFELQGDRLYMAHSGAPFTEDDVRALCILGVSSKSDEHATIGQKGRGFTSVLEITDSPNVYSTTHDFGFERERAFDTIRSELDLETSLSPSDVPVLTMPFHLEERPDRVTELLAEDSPFTTVFEFELREGRHDVIKSRLTEINPQIMVFLRQLGSLEIAIDGDELTWDLDRDPLGTESDTDVSVSRIDITCSDSSGSMAPDEPVHQFVRFRKADIPVTARNGLEGPNWSDVEYTEVGAACRYEQIDGTFHLRPFEGHPTIHLFLPTEEPSPFPLLLNGAFKPDSSRTGIPIVDEEDGYNAFLLEELAALVADDLLDYATDSGTQVDEFLSCIHLVEDAFSSDAAVHLADSVVSGLADRSFLPVADGDLACRVGDNRYAPTDLALPYSHTNARWIGRETVICYGPARLPKSIDPQERRFPAVELLEERYYETLEFLGLDRLNAFEIPPLLAAAESARTAVRDYDAVGTRRGVDPVLNVLIGIESTTTDEEIRTEFLEACRATAVFPVSVDQDGTVDRTATEGSNLLFPPEEFDSRLQLAGVRFFAPRVYRPPGWTRPRGDHGDTDEFQSQLKAIWDIEPFDFQSFAQAVILPRLPRSRRPLGHIEDLQSISELRVIRELAGESSNPEDPLPHQPRKPTELYRLCMLPVPTKDNGWVPAYKVYFGEEWFADFESHASPLPILDACPGIDVPTLVSPREFITEADLRAVAEESDDDTAEALATRRHEWFRFFRWLGVSPHLRLTPLFDPEHEREYPATEDLGRPSPDHPTLGALPESDWNRFRSQLREAVGDSAASDRENLSIYRASRLEYWEAIRDAANEDIAVGIDLFCHLSYWWERRFSEETTVGVGGHSVPASYVSSRNRGVPNSTEQYELGDNLWLWELKTTTWCPSIHGQFEPARVWQRTESLIQQFTIGEDTVLLPVLHDEIEARLNGSTPEGMCRALGIRATMASAEFKPNDAQLICTLLASEAEAASSGFIENNLPTFRTAYRELATVMPSRKAMHPPESWQSSADALSSTPVLCELADGEFGLRDAGEAYYVTSKGERRQIPLTDPPVFILQETEAGSYGAYFGMPSLVDSVETDFDRDDADVDEALTQRITAFIRDRTDALRCLFLRDRPAQQQTDADSLERFTAELAVVDDLEVMYRLGEFEEPSASEWFIESPDRAGERRVPYVLASEDGSVQSVLDTVAKALCEFLDYPNIGDVILILRTESVAERDRKLELLDAPRDLLEATEPGGGFERLGGVGTGLGENYAGHETENAGTPLEPEQAREDAERTPPNSSDQNPADRVWDPDQLTFTLADGTVIEGADLDFPADASSAETSRGSNGSGSGKRASPATGGVKDVLGTVGEQLAYKFECSRLAEEYGVDDPEQYVFRVSDRSDIERARKDIRAQSILQRLTTDIGLDRSYPGFDILSVDPESETASPEIERLIEVKSKAEDGPVLLSLNEWTSAQHEELQSVYYLYVMADLGRQSAGRPFIRTVENPAEILLAEPKEQESLSFEVDTRRFRNGGTVEEIPMREDTK